jgi:hypothetical protein
MKLQYDYIYTVAMYGPNISRLAVEYRRIPLQYMICKPWQNESMRKTMNNR